MLMTENEIAIVNHRSEFSGDVTPGQIRISQKIQSPDGTQYEVWTDTKERTLAMYREKGGKTYAYTFTIDHTAEGSGLVIKSAAVKVKEGENKYRDIDHLAYSPPDKDGRQYVRNAIVLPEDTMINDQSVLTTVAATRSKYDQEFATAEFAIAGQQEYIKQVAAQLGLNFTSRFAARSPVSVKL